ncbi:hypothetical protein M747DRAFT_47891 [Aspergillus niger ATCC 13496]|uniref:Uncharacterized protein n=1 Tax=Aspergillus niger ATCC 13496 TaxID=1353008 RepID=A0A370BXD7_ASPNG|nr:hypothetical protein M747DRAFT_47891 [Aspergillus niger ATCC 13496]
MSARAESEECDPVQTAPQSPSGPLYQSCMYTKNHVSTFIAAFLFLSLFNPLSSAHPALKGTNSRPLFFSSFKGVNQSKAPQQQQNSKRTNINKWYQPQTPGNASKFQLLSSSHRRKL